MGDTARHRRNIFFILSVAGAILVTTELALELFNGTLCVTEGCHIVVRQTRFGSISILLPGLAMFLILAILAKVKTTRHRQYVDTSISMLLNAALAAEGFLVGYQAFRLEVFCAFCLAVFGLFVILGIIWISAGNRNVMCGFVGFFAVLIFLYLIQPTTQNNTATGQNTTLHNSRITLLFDDSCASCREIDTMCRELEITVNKLNAKNHAALLDFLGINQVPVLIINDGDHKTIMVGKSKIREYIEDNLDDLIRWETGRAGSSS